MISTRWTIILAMVAWNGPVHAVGLGPLELESSLGQPLRAKIPVMESARKALGTSCVRARVQTLDGALLADARVSLATSDSRTLLTLVSRESINEPAISVHVEMECGQKVQRSYQLLLDFAAAPVNQATSLAVLQPSSSISNLDQRSTNRPSENSKRPYRETAAARNAAAGRTAVDDDSPDSRATVRRDIGKTKKEQDEQKVSRSVLRLSSSEPAFSAGMKMSNSLAMGTSDVPTSPISADQLRAARNQFAAILRGEDPVLAAALETEAAKSKLQKLEIEKVSLAQAKDAERAAFEERDRQSYPASLVAILAGLLMFSLGAAGWLGLRLKKAGEAQPEWWKATNVVVDDDSDHAVPESPRHAVRRDPEISQSNVNARSVYEPSAAIEPRFESARPAFSSVSAHPSTGQSAVVDLPPLEITPSDTLGFQDTVGAFHGHYADPGRHLNVEEVSDIVQEAEFWMMLNDPKRALQLLEPHADVDRPDSPVTWLYLIDLYRLTGNREKYEALGQRFKRIFNARIPAWDEDLHTIQSTSLEDFPGLLDRIVGVWANRQAAIGFLESLLVDDRDGERVGFDLPVYKDIILLIGVANEAARLRAD